MKKFLKELGPGDDIMIVHVTQKEVSVKKTTISDKYDIKHQNGVSRMLYVSEHNKNRHIFTAHDGEEFKVVDCSTEYVDKTENDIYCIPGFDYYPILKKVIDENIDDLETKKEYIDIAIRDLKELKDVLF